MPETRLLWWLALYAMVPGQDLDGTRTLELLLDVGLELGTLLLVFTLAIFVVLVFAVRVLMVATGKPVPVDPFDMAKPKDFRALMLGSAGLLTPLVAQSFLPLEGFDSPWALPIAYAFEILVVLILWLALHLFYKVRQKRSQRKT